MCASACLCVYVCVCLGQRTIFRSQFYPSTLWVPVIKLELSGLLERKPFYPLSLHTCSPPPTAHCQALKPRRRLQTCCVVDVWPSLQNLSFNQLWKPSCDVFNSITVFFISRVVWLFFVSLFLFS